MLQGASVLHVFRKQTSNIRENQGVAQTSLIAAL